MPALIDLTGQTFGRLTVIKRDTSRSKRPFWICKCTCGNIKSIVGWTLKAGKSQSCGCLGIEAVRAARTTHGQSGTRLYKTWKRMRSRCNCPTMPDYKHYGGRGISICAQWDTFKPFKKWAIANGYAPNLTIERIDNDKGYSPQNCTWIPQTEQPKNRRPSSEWDRKEN